MVCSVSRDPREFVVSYFYVILEHEKFGNRTSLELHYYETNQTMIISLENIMSHNL